MRPASATRLRLPIGLFALIGIGGLVAAAVAVSLALGLSSATENTRRLLSAEADTLLDVMERRLEDHLAPVVEQARWIDAQFQAGSLRVDSPSALATLDAFMRGALAGTSQVAGIAVVTPDGTVRRWQRAPFRIVQEDWSPRPEIMAWLTETGTDPTPRWFPPFFTSTIDAFVILHGAGLVDGTGRHVATLGQIVRIADLSAELEQLVEGTRLVPFVLIDGTRVLAHPNLVEQSVANTRDDAPLATLHMIGDEVLAELWSPDAEPLFMLARTNRTEARQIGIDDGDYAFLTRDIPGRGAERWTIGAWFSLDNVQSDVIGRLLSAFIGGALVLAVAVLASLLLARRIARPTQAIAAVARSVSEGDFASISTLPKSRLREVDDAASALNRMVDDLRERQTIRDTLGRFLPEQVARRLLRDDGVLGAESVEASVLFCDLEGFSTLTEQLGSQEIVALLNEYFGAMTEILEHHDAVITQFQGDAILATFNVPIANPRHAHAAVEAALEMQRLVHARRFAGEALGIRIGIDTGSVVAGAVGAPGRQSYTVHGDAVNTASRLEQLNKTHGTRIIASAETIRRAGHACGKRSLGTADIRGRAASVEVFALDWAYSVETSRESMTTA